MMLFLEVIVGLGLVTFPIVMGLLKGTVDYSFYWGVVFGTHYDKLDYKVEEEGRDVEYWRLHILQFHFLCVTIMMSFSRRTA